VQSSNILNYSQCKHAKLTEPDGLALITIGSTFRGDFGIAPALCNVLPAAVVRDVCRFDLGSNAGFIADSLYNHKAAIIIDSTVNGTASGTVSILDLGTILDRVTPINIPLSHGMSVCNEIRAAKKHAKLPARMIFFGVEARDLDEYGCLSNKLQKRLPGLVDHLSLLVTRVLETLQRNA